MQQITELGGLFEGNKDNKEGKGEEIQKRKGWGNQYCSLCILIFSLSFINTSAQDPFNFEF